VPPVIALAVLALAHVFDWASFMVMVGRHGLSAEANPIVVQVFEETGIPGVTLAKVATVIFAAILALLILPNRRRLGMGLITFGVVAGLFGGLTNIATL
jgi:hypothetical protein